MGDTYSQITIQIVFAVKNREAKILPSFENDLYKYITGIVQTKGQKLLAINGMPDHIHILIGMKPTCNLSDLVREIKKSSTEYINSNRFGNFIFRWQNGFGAFSYSSSHLERVINYVRNQKEHHRNKSFKTEYIDFLEKFSVPYEDKYLFEWFDEEVSN